MMKIIYGLLVLLCVRVSQGYFILKCTSEEFPCQDGQYCIDKLRWCDSYSDCEDDSDELYCNERSGGIVANVNHCNEEIYFLCNDGPCIPWVGRCDGYSSCRDGSDEADCVFNKTSTLEKEESSKLPLASEKSGLLDEVLHTSYKSKDLLQADSAVKNTGDIEFIDAVNHLDASKTHLPVTDNRTIEDSGSKHVSLHDDILQEEISTHVDLDKTRTTEHVIQTSNFAMNPVSESQPTTLKFNPVDTGIHFIDVHKQNESLELNSTHDTEVRDHVNNADVSSKIHKLNLKPTEHSIHQADHHTAGEMEASLEKGFVELNSRQYRKQVSDAFRWLCKVRNEDYGWGDDTTRAVIALNMADDDSLRKKPSDKMLMLKQLHLKLFEALIRNRTNPLSLGEAALYINALSASCENPRNFYGQDLVKTLRYRTNDAQSASKFVTPLVYMTLCLNDATTYEDLRKLQAMLYGHNKIDRIDIVAIISLASTCISRSQKFSSFGLGQQAAKTLYRKVVDEGLPENIYELSLVSQALNEAGINHDLWNRSLALQHIIDSQQTEGSFGDILASYYVVPVLLGKSLLSLNRHCHRNEKLVSGLAPLEVLKNGRGEKRYVHYSLYFGNPVEVSQTLIMQVQKTTNFLDIMRIAETINPLYKFRYDMSQGKPYVYSIGGEVNDAERGLYWTLHVSSKQNYTDKNLVPYEGDIRSFIPGEEDILVYWMKPIF